ncbi:MAG: tyrosine-type recombinase/integrase [Actinomycetota bacterium]
MDRRAAPSPRGAREGGLAHPQRIRHTMASHWVFDGRPIEKLKEILGHSSVLVTERYAHLRPDAFTAEDYRAACVDLAEPKVVSMAELTTERPVLTGHSLGHRPLAGLKRNVLR